MTQKIADLMSTGEMWAPPFVVYDDAFSQHLIRRYRLSCEPETLTGQLVYAGEAYVHEGPFNYRPLSGTPAFRDSVQAIASAVHRAAGLVQIARGDDLPGLHKGLLRAGVRGGELKSLNGSWRPNNDDRQALFLCQRTLLALEKSLTAASKTQLRDKQPARKGRPLERGLSAFVSHLATTWVKAAARPFTVDYSTYGGKGAVRFIVEALQQLDDVPTEAVISAARRIRKQAATDKKAKRAR